MPCRWQNDLAKVMWRKKTHINKTEQNEHDTNELWMIALLTQRSKNKNDSSKTEPMKRVRTFYSFLLGVKNKMYAYEREKEINWKNVWSTVWSECLRAHTRHAPCAFLFRLSRTEHAESVRTLLRRKRLRVKASSYKTKNHHNTSS